MRLSVPAWSFPALTLPEVAGVARAIGITAVDVGLFYRSALDRARLLAAPEALADELLQLGSAFSNLYWLFGAAVVQRNLADPTARAANRHDFAQVLRARLGDALLRQMLPDYEAVMTSPSAWRCTAPWISPWRCNTGC